MSPVDNTNLDERKQRRFSGSPIVCLVLYFEQVILMIHRQWKRKLLAHHANPLDVVIRPIIFLEFQMGIADPK